MAQQFASYEAIARTESYEEENGVAVADGAGSGRGRRYVSVLAVLLAVVGTALLVTSTYSATAPAASQPVVSGTAFDSKLSATKIADLSEIRRVHSEISPPTSFPLASWHQPRRS